MAKSGVVSHRARCAACCVALAAAVLWIPAAGAAAPAECDEDTAYLTWRPVDGENHKLSVIDMESGKRKDVAELSVQLNAVGWSQEQHRLFGVGRSDDGPRLVSIDPDGEVDDHGELHGSGADSDGLSGAFVGTVVSERLLMLAGNRILSVNLDDDPGETVVTAELDEPLEDLDVGDVDYHAATGTLYGLSSKQGELVAVELDTGAVDRMPVSGMAAHSLVGALFLDESKRRVYGVVNGVDGEAVVYRVPLPAHTSEKLKAEEIARWTEIASADAALCRRPEPDPPPEPTPPPSPPPSPPPAETQSPPPVEEPEEELSRPPLERGGHEAEEEEIPKRWIAVGIVALAVVGSAGVKAGPKSRR
ncbi:MAG: DUF6923 family protein [Stackebrandtia sp.]